MNLQKTAEALEAKGYGVSVFRTAEEAAGYLNGEIDGTTVGIGGSVTLDQMGVYESLSAHNQVYCTGGRRKAPRPKDCAGRLPARTSI